MADISRTMRRSFFLYIEISPRETPDAKAELEANKGDDVSVHGVISEYEKNNDAWQFHHMQRECTVKMHLILDTPLESHFCDQRFLHGFPSAYYENAM